MPRAVITGMKPPGNRRNTTKAKRRRKSRPRRRIASGRLAWLCGRLQTPLHFFRGRLMPPDVDDILIVPLEPRNDHGAIV